MDSGYALIYNTFMYHNILKISKSDPNKISLCSHHTTAHTYILQYA